VHDRNDALARVAGGKLDLGCGSRKRGPEYIGVDRLDAPGVDIVGEVGEVLAAIPDGVVDEIVSAHFLEHVADVDRLLSEMLRVVRPGGRIVVEVPHFSNPYYFSDLTHRNFFGLYSFAYYTNQVHFKRQVPTYGRELPFRLDSVRLVFKSPRPFYVRYAIKRLIGLAVNLSRATQEFYEENLCYLLPCYELRYVLVHDDGPAKLGGES
jgi:ubiquinone/menaquinone biosynthesis C-methylase UbiE